MRYLARTALPVFSFLFVVAAFMVVPSLIRSAGAQPACIVFTCKSAPELPPPLSEDDFVFFDFTIVFDGTPEPISIPANTQRCAITGFNPSQTVEIIEESNPGWILTDIECTDSQGIDVSSIDNGVALGCISQSEITCTFTNVRGVATNIPTLSEWGMIAAAAGLAMIGVFFAIRKRREQAV
jgi:hypothetical protein